MKKNLKKFVSRFITFFIILITVTTSFDVNVVLAAESEPSVLVKKISKDYTKKFCNSIAFGLSKDSAMKFSLAENKKVFEKRKGFKDIDKDSIAEEVAIAVVNSCGYPLNLYGEKGIKEFENYYIMKEKEYSIRIENNN